MLLLLRGSRRSGSSCLASLEEVSVALTSCHAGPHAAPSQATVSGQCRQFSSSGASAYKFQSVLVQAPPKAKIFNKDNFKRWRNSNFSPEVGQAILQGQFQSDDDKVQASKLQHELNIVLSDVQTVSGLRQVVNTLAEHMEPWSLVRAIRKVAQVCQNEAEESVPLMNQLLHRLQPKASSLTTSQLSTVLLFLTKAEHAPHPELFDSLLYQFEGEAGIERLRSAKIEEISGLLFACSRLGSSSIKLVEKLCFLASMRMHEMNGRQLSIAARAMREPVSTADPIKKFWRKVVQTVGQRHKQMAKEEALELTNIMRSAMRATRQPDPSKKSTYSAIELNLSVLPICFSSLTPYLSSLPPEGLINLVWLFSKDGPQELQTDRAGLDLLCEAAAHSVTRFSTRNLAALMEGLVAAEHQGLVVMKLCADLLFARGFAVRHPHPDPIQGWKAGDADGESLAAARLAHALASAGLGGDHAMWHKLAADCCKAIVVERRHWRSQLPLTTALLLMRAFKAAGAGEASVKLAAATSPYLKVNTDMVPRFLIVPTLVTVAWMRWQQGPPPGAEEVQGVYVSSDEAEVIASTDAALQSLAARVAELKIGDVKLTDLADVREALDYGYLQGHPLHAWRGKR